MCSRCGKEATHASTNGKWTAIGSQCTFCDKKNHWHTVCRKRLAAKIHALQSTKEPSTPSSSDSKDTMDNGYAPSYKGAMLSTNTVSPSRNGRPDKWQTTLQTGGKDIPFRIDTGSFARCKVMTREEHTNTPRLGTMRKSNKVLYFFTNHRLYFFTNHRLYFFTNHRLHPASVTKLLIGHNGTNKEADFEIITLQQEDVISRDLAEKLRLIKRIHELDLQTTVASKELGVPGPSQCH